MRKKYRMYQGAVVPDPGGFILEEHNWWEDDVLLQIKPWHPALFYRYLFHLAEWDPAGHGEIRRGDASPVHVARGQIYMSLEEYGDAPGWSKQTTAKRLARLEKLGKITVEAFRGGTRVTIVGFARSQDFDYYRGTRTNVDSRQNGQTVDAEGDATGDAGSDGISSDDSPAFEGEGATPQETRTGTRRGRDVDANNKKLSGTLGIRGARAREGGEPEAAVCMTWQAIAKMIELDLWRFCPEEIKALQIAEAAGAGPPPDTLPPSTRAMLIRERDRLLNAGEPYKKSVEEDHQPPVPAQAMPVAETSQDGTADCGDELVPPAPARAYVRQELERSWADDRADRRICSDPGAPSMGGGQVREPRDDDGRGG